MTGLMHHLLDEAAARAPDGIAVRCDDHGLTWEELAVRAWSLAAALLDGGVRPRDRVAVYVDKGLRVPAALYGTMAAGATLVPVDPRSPATQVSRILRDTGATRLVTEPGKRHAVIEALADNPEVVQVIGLAPGEDLGRAAVPWESVEAQRRGSMPPVRLIEQDPCYILHTSGSTGLPKLILHTHHSARSFVDWAVSEYRITPDDRLSNHSSHHTCFATFDFYAAAGARASTIILTPSVMMMPGSLSELLEREGVTIWYSVPTALVQLSLRGGLEHRDLSSIRWVLFAGEVFPGKHLHRIMRQLPAARFSHVYGSTEVNVCTYYHLPPVSDLQGVLPIGRPCSTSSTVIVDEAGADIPRGEAGELWVRGSTVMSGYWGDPERNRAVLVQRPTGGSLTETYFRTGDRVREIDDGNLAFVARADRQVKVRGYRVELEEVESALLSLPEVEEAAAFTVDDGEGSLSIRAAVVNGDAPEDRAERRILEGLSRLLPPQALPERIHLVPSMPRTPTGKIDGKALKKKLTEARG
jgi:amino acid adenylation domain-containing protein